MHLRLIDGGLSGPTDKATASHEQSAPTPQDVQREAARRLDALDWQRWQNRTVLTGCSIPKELRYLAMQITYAAEAIARLAVIPGDYRSDAYWPMPVAFAQNNVMMR